MKTLPFSTLRCYANCIQGERHHMEDNYAIAYQERPCLHENKSHDSSEPSTNIDFYYFGVFDGHGGQAASEFARSHLLNHIVAQTGFWTDDDEQVTEAIKKGFRAAHLAMHEAVASWPKSTKDLPSTSGTTASVIFIKNGKYYVGHVGDSRIVLASENTESGQWIAKSMTIDHKPESPEEISRIEKAGGSVAKKNGVDRVVWEKPVLKPFYLNGATPEIENSFSDYRFSNPSNYPIEREFISTIISLPFLAVARSLGDLWSYNHYTKEYIVSPDPDVVVRKIDQQDRAIILASDGLWNMVSSRESVRLVQELVDSRVERELFEHFEILDEHNVSASLVHYATQQWRSRKLKSDNISTLVILLGKNETNESTNGLDDKASCQHCSCSGVSKVPAGQSSKAQSSPVLIADSSQYPSLNIKLSLSSFPDPSSPSFNNCDDPLIVESYGAFADENMIIDKPDSAQISVPVVNDSKEQEMSRSEEISTIDSSSATPAKQSVIKTKRDAQTQANMPPTFSQIMTDKTTDRQSKELFIGESMFSGQFIYCGRKSALSISNVLPVGSPSQATTICKDEDESGDREKLALVSDVYASVVGHNPDTKKSKNKLPSGAKKTVSSSNRAMVGVIAGGRIEKASRSHHKYKAKRSCWSKIRGVALNPVEYPHGGNNQHIVHADRTTRRDTSASRKVGLIALRRSGRIRASLGAVPKEKD